MPLPQLRPRPARGGCTTSPCPSAAKLGKRGLLHSGCKRMAVPSARWTTKSHIGNLTDGALDVSFNMWLRPWSYEFGRTAKEHPTTPQLRPWGPLTTVALDSSVIWAIISCQLHPRVSSFHFHPMPLASWSMTATGVQPSASKCKVGELDGSSAFSCCSRKNLSAALC